MAMDKDPKDLLLRIIHKWQSCGGNLLKVKELQSFKSNTILTFFNIFTATPKKYLLQETRSILKEAQTMAQEVEPDVRSSRQADQGLEYKLKRDTEVGYIAMKTKY